MTTLRQDLRYGVRMLAKSPRFTLVVILVLALGIGANTAIFTLIDALLLKPLPGVQDPQQLVLMTEAGDSSLAWLTYPHYVQLGEECRSFSGLFASAQIRKRHLLVGGAGGWAESIQAQAVSPNFFEVLGVRIAFGRSLRPNGGQAEDSLPVAVISYGFWQRRFGLDPTAIGRRITLDDIPFTIVGVAPRGFRGFEVGRNPDLWWPIQMVPSVEGQKDVLTDRGFTWLRVLGRLKPGVTREQASAEMSGIYRRIIDEESVRWRLSEEQRQRRLAQKVGLQAGGAGSTALGHEFRRPLVLLMVMVSLVLLVACANLAGLLLARGATRHHELSTRLALGASCWTLSRQLITESLLLAAAGGVLGLLLAQWGVHLVAGYLPGYGRTILLELTPDLRVLAFTFLVSAATGVLSGLVPAWRGSHIDLAATLKDRTARGAGTGLGQRWNKLLVVSQLALSGCLLIGAGLFVRTVQKLNALDCGFNREHLMTFELEVGKDSSQAQRTNLCHQVLQRLESLPGVRCAGLSSTRSLTGADGGWGSWKVVAEDAGPDAGEGVEITSVCVTPRYFETMGIPLLRGREFLPQDESAPRAGGTSPVPPVAIVDEALARRLFGNDDPVGRHLRSLNRRMPLLEIVGVARNVRHYGLREQPTINLYNVETNYYRGCLFFYVRTFTSPSALAPGIRQIVREIDPTVAVAGLRTMREVVDDHLSQDRLISHLASLFSLSALAVACLGLYGTLSYTVARRTQEIGIRMALGARAGDVLSLVVRQGMVLAVTGCAIGLVLAAALTRLIASQLYGVTSVDPLTFMGVGLVLLTSALLACYLPARRAARIDPMVALRYE
jgi:predicted permease